MRVEVGVRVGINKGLRYFGSWWTRLDRTGPDWTGPNRAGPDRVFHAVLNIMDLKIN